MPTTEDLIDSLGVKGLLESMADVCQDKAEHIRANWQCETLAEAWEMRSRLLYALSRTPQMD